MGLYTPGLSEFEHVLARVRDSISRCVLDVGLDQVMECGNLGILIPKILLPQFTQVGVTPHPSIIGVVICDTIGSKIGGHASQGICRGLA